MSKKTHETFGCAKCGKEAVNHYVGEIAMIMDEEGLCFECAYWVWQHRLDYSGKRKFAIVDGYHYVLAPHTDTNWLVGSCGQKYHFLFNNGEELVCDNVWHQGQVPEHFRDIMPDNATLID